MELVLLTILNIVSYASGIVLRYVPFAELVTKKQKQKIFLLYTLALLVNAGIFYKLNYMGMSSLAYIKSNIVLFGIVTTGINILVIRDRVKEHLFTLGITITWSYMILTCVTIAVQVLIGIDTATDYVIWNGAYCIVFWICYFPFRKIIVNTVRPFLTIDCGDYWKTIWFIPIAIFTATFIAHPGNQHVENGWHILSRLLLWITTIAICRNIVPDHQRIRERQALQELVNMQQEYYDELSEHVRNARKSRHDFKHHIAVIQHYIDTDDKSGLGIYCDSMLEEQRRDVEIPYTGNTAVDGVVYRYAVLAKEKDVRFEFSGLVEQLDIPDVELCVLLGNALDNALTGCLTVKNNSYISVKMKVDGHMQSIMISNSFDGVVKERDGVILSRKRENASGVGISSMKDICEKNGAVMDIRYTKDCFSALFVINMK